MARGGGEYAVEFGYVGYGWLMVDLASRRPPGLADGGSRTGQLVQEDIVVPSVLASVPGEALTKDPALVSTDPPSWNWPIWSGCKLNE